MVALACCVMRELCQFAVLVLDMKQVKLGYCFQYHKLGSVSAVCNLQDELVLWFGRRTLEIIRHLVHHTLS